jgi:hypothetical protein
MKLLTRIEHLDLRPRWLHIWALYSAITLAVFFWIGSRNKEDYWISLLRDPAPLIVALALMLLFAGFAYLRLNKLFISASFGHAIGLLGLVNWSRLEFGGLEGVIAVVFFSLAFGAGIAFGVIIELVSYALHRRHGTAAKRR